MLSRHYDPIIAIATAPGRGSVGIVRISGKDLEPLVRALFGRELPPRVASYLPFTDADGAVIDKGLALYFKAPHSFTGEDVLELQGHGGPVVLQLLMGRCLALAAQAVAPGGAPLLSGLRLAQPGEFSERAFLNDKLDLAQAEAIADLIDASTEAAARSASQSMTGVFSQRVHTIRDALIHLRMLVEATLDFPEEEIDFLQKADAQGQARAILIELDGVLREARQGALLREGIRVVIAGQPNVGKSSLLNALAGAELAIVTPIAGTTRDKVEQTIQIEGVPIHIIDTAGLRESSDTVEKIGISRAWEAIRSADVLIFLRDLSRKEAPEYRAEDANIARAIADNYPPALPMIEVWNKSDAVRGVPPPTSGLSISTKTLDGLQTLREQLLHAAGWQTAQTGSFMARERHLQALRNAMEYVQSAFDHLDAGGLHLDLMAEELRLGQTALGQITGEFTSDDLLGVIFSKFCIGK